MSEIRVDKIINEVGTGPVELTQGATFPIGKSISGSGDLNISGIITASSVNVTDNSSYKIGGTDVVSATTLGSGILTSSLTSVGTLGSLSVGNVNSTGIITATTFVGALTGTASSVTTNANLTGDVTSIGNATAIAAGVIIDADINASAAIAVSKLAASTISGVTLGNNLNALTISTGLSGSSYNGSGAVTIAIDSTVATLTGTQTFTNKTLTSPTLTTPVLGTPSSGTLTSCTGLPLTTGVTGTLPVANGGTGVTASTGTGSVVLSASPTFTGTVGAAAITATGDIAAANFNSTSDISLKDNIQTIVNPLDKIIKLNGVTFNWKENQKPSIGVIAQELEKVLPELVTQGEVKSVNYNGIIGVLIEAIKELKKEIEDLKETK